LSAWGEFNPADIANLKDKGVFVYFCEKNRNDDFVAPDGVATHMVSDGKSRTLFVLISSGALDESKLPLAELDHSKSLSELRAERESIEAKISSLNAKIAGMRTFAEEIKDSVAGLKMRLDIASAVDSMKGGGSLSCISGYIPSGDEPALREAAKQNGWGLVIEDAALDDRFVPTKIEIPKIFRIVRPVFEFIGIEPGYDEVDVSICFLFFFSIFFAMIVGDAGYGCLFLASAIFAKFKFGGKEEMKTPLNLFTVLSVCTIVWGALCGSWFSIDSSMLPAPMRGLRSLTDSAVKDKTVQTFCFLLAALHLSAGRIWRAILFSNRKSLGQIGWLLMIWMNFFLIKGLLVDGGVLKTGIIITLLGISLVLLVIFYVDWKNLGDIFNFPFAIIGSFSDVLSYIRLYAVGLASYYLAVNVNQIGAMFFDSKIFFVVGLLIILFGHALNVTLCLLGVLVHGIRLNALEFSNHMELQWKGLKYQPLKIKGLPEIQQ
jgi:V/A-type H+-transporting ATPase subunit I